jgi:hypothetical protein
MARVIIAVGHSCEVTVQDVEAILISFYNPCDFEVLAMGREQTPLYHGCSAHFIEQTWIAALWVAAQYEEGHYCLFVASENAERESFNVGVIATREGKKTETLLNSWTYTQKGKGSPGLRLKWIADRIGMPVSEVDERHFLSSKEETLRSIAEIAASLFKK